VLLGIHNLARYTDEDGALSVLTRGWLRTSRTILYNFEDARGQTDFQSQNMWKLLKGFDGRVWDYHRGNVGFLREQGIRAVHVPVGYGPALRTEPEQAGSLRGLPAFDVLFVGRMNAYRRGVIDELRRQGIQVVHGNAVAPLYGAELRANIRAARIVLNLRFFAEDDEWKATRFMLPLANGVLVVSEESGHEDDLAYWRDGIVFRERGELAAALRYYLERGEERARVAARGLELFAQQPMHANVRRALESTTLPDGAQFCQ